LDPASNPIYLLLFLAGVALIVFLHEDRSHDDEDANTGR
jgi:hypothetical protein